MARTIKLAALAFAAAAAMPVGPAYAVGRFAYVDGGVTVRDASGTVRPARPGERINEGDSIHTGNGRAQIRFDDKGWISLQPLTVFEVKEYSQRDGNIALSLLKGGLRAVSGLIADRNPSRFHMDTIVATIGIRGTSFQATLCTQSCNVPDGLYVTGGDGTTFVRNAFGEIDLSRGRSAFVASAKTAPAESNVKPVGSVRPPTTVQELANVGATTPSELQPGNFIYFPGTPFTPPLQVRSVTSAGGGIAASGIGSATATVILRGTTQLFSDSATGSAIAAGAGVIGSGQQAALTLDAAQRPVSVSASDNLGNFGSITALTVPEFAFSDGILYWGRWTNAQFSVSAQATGESSSGFGTVTLPSGTYLHYIFGIPAASVPLIGSAGYTFIGGTGSTSVAGTVGAGITAGTLSANFGSNTVSTNVTINHGGTFTANGFATLTAGNRAQFSSISGSTSGAGSFPFRFEGFFAGAPAPTAPPRAGITWEISRPDAIVGTGAFRCSSGC